MLGGAMAVVEFALLAMWGPLPRAVIMVAAINAVGWATLAIATRHRASAIRISAARLGSAGGVEAIGAYDEVVSGLAYLEAADEALNAGRISAAQHEVAWARVWEMLSDRASPGGRRVS